MNALTTNMQALNESGATILKGRSKGNYFKVLYKDGDMVRCKTEAGTKPAKEFFKPFPTEKESQVKMLYLLLKKAQQTQHELIKLSDTEEDKKSMQKIMQNLDLAVCCAESFNLSIHGVKF
jgi:hypothetical protein